MKRKREDEEPPLFFKSRKRHKPSKPLKKWTLTTYSTPAGVPIPRWSKPPIPSQYPYTLFSSQKSLTFQYNTRDYDRYVLNKKKKTRPKKRINGPNNIADILKEAASNPNSPFPTFHLPPVDGKPPPPPDDNEPYSTPKPVKKILMPMKQNIDINQLIACFLKPPVDSKEEKKKKKKKKKDEVYRTLEEKRKMETKNKTDKKVVKVKKSRYLGANEDDIYPSSDDFEDFEDEDDLDLDLDLDYDNGDNDEEGRLMEVHEDDKKYFNDNDRYYRNDDDEWTKEQTDELFELCSKFNLSFVVIQDRLSFYKSLESIKKRYLYISKQLLIGRSRDDFRHIQKLDKMKKKISGYERRKKKGKSSRDRAASSYSSVNKKEKTEMREAANNTSINHLNSYIKSVRKNHPIMKTKFDYREEVKRKKDIINFYGRNFVDDYEESELLRQLQENKELLELNKIEADHYKNIEKINRIYGLRDIDGDLKFVNTEDDDGEYNEQLNYFTNNNQVISTSTLVNTDLDRICNDNHPLTEESVMEMKLHKIILPSKNIRLLKYHDKETLKHVEQLIPLVVQYKNIHKIK